MNILTRHFDEQEMRDRYKRVAWLYDFWSWLTETKAAKYTLELAEIRNHQKIIEIAVGTGMVFEKVVRQNPDGTNIGVDLSPEMLSKTRKRLSKLADHHYELKEADVMDLEYPDQSFDILINNFMVDMMPEEYFDTIAEKYYRMLKTGGVALVSTFSFGKKKVHKFWYWIAKNFPGVLTGCRPVSFSRHLMNAGFTIEKDLEISQNTFPSEIIKARK